MTGVRAHLVFHGRLNLVSFADFARHRAQRLDLGLILGSLSTQAADLTVDGAGDLIDAFEMACSLGPHDCLITHIDRQDLP
jgi:acylphosphatase